MKTLPECGHLPVRVLIGVHQNLALHRHNLVLLLAQPPLQVLDLLVQVQRTVVRGQTVDAIVTSCLVVLLQATPALAAAFLVKENRK